jgi:hypothetical protein
MLIDSVYKNLSGDDEMAFLAIESEYRKTLNNRLDNADRDAAWSEYYVDYINGVMAAATALNIKALAQYVAPSQSSISYENFRDFRLFVETIVVQTNIRCARKLKGTVIELDKAAKERILINLKGLRDAINNLDVTELKRQAIEKRLNKFEEEINSGKTLLETFGFITVWVGGIMGEAAIKAEPVRKFADSIANLLDKATDYTYAILSLPAPSTPKQLEPPKKPKSPDIDEDIPF